MALRRAFAGGGWLPRPPLLPLVIRCPVVMGRRTSPLCRNRGGAGLRCPRNANWMKASPWLIGANPRGLFMPVDGDDGFYPTGNELFMTENLLKLHLVQLMVSNLLKAPMMDCLLHLQQCRSNGNSFHLSKDDIEMQFATNHVEVEALLIIPLISMKI